MGVLSFPITIKQTTNKSFYSHFNECTCLHLTYHLTDLEINDYTSWSRRSVLCIGSLLDVDTNWRLQTKIYDKSDDFNFPTVIFPFLNNITYSFPSAVVYINRFTMLDYSCFFSQPILLHFVTKDTHSIVLILVLGFGCYWKQWSMGQSLLLHHWKGSGRDI